MDGYWFESNRLNFLSFTTIFEMELGRKRSTRLINGRSLVRSQLGAFRANSPVVRILAFQASGPGSIPGWRISGCMVQWLGLLTLNQAARVRIPVRPERSLLTAILTLNIEKKPKQTVRLVES